MPENEQKKADLVQRLKDNQQAHKILRKFFGEALAFILRLQDSSMEFILVNDETSCARN